MSSPQLTPDQAKFVLGAALPTLKNEHQTTKRVIEAIPLDKGDYRPDAVSKTALEVACGTSWLRSSAFSAEYLREFLISVRFPGRSR